MTTATTGHVIRLRLVCEGPPSQNGVEFGLQDKAGRLEPGVSEPDGSLRFVGEVRAVTLADGDVRLRGAIVHGSPQAPFLYLSCRPASAPDAPWIFRMKIPLQNLDTTTSALKGRVRASRGGTVPLLGRGWTRISDE